MGKTQKHRKRADEKGQKGGRIKKFLSFLVKATLAYVQLTFVAIIIILGFVGLYDIIVGDDYPQIETLLSPQDLKLAETIQDANLVRNFDPKRAWESLQPALQILDDVCPEASAWARERHQNKKIIWEDSTFIEYDMRHDGGYASFDPYTRKLTINSDMFALKNSERACTIAHEFRHSRQNISKYIRSSCGLLITGRRDDDIVETDAYLYEARVRSAIYGR